MSKTKTISASFASAVIAAGITAGTLPQETKETIIEKNSIEYAVGLVGVKDRARIKALALSEIELDSNFYENGELKIEIMKKKEKEGKLIVWVKAWRNDKEIIVNNPYLILNPPIMIPDGTFTTDKEGNSYANFKEDPEMALKMVIHESLLNNYNFK